MGADTSFSALEAAGAQEDLAKAGLNTTQIIAAMPGVLSMAAAGDIGLSQAAEAATDTMKTFRMEASQIGFIATSGRHGQPDVHRHRADDRVSQKFLGRGRHVGCRCFDLSAMIALWPTRASRASRPAHNFKRAMLRISAPNKDAVNNSPRWAWPTRDARGNILPISTCWRDLKPSWPAWARASERTS
jgi:hypothetical protein